MTEAKKAPPPEKVAVLVRAKGANTRKVAGFCYGRRYEGEEFVLPTVRGVDGKPVLGKWMDLVRELEPREVVPAQPAGKSVLTGAVSLARGAQDIGADLV